MVLVLGSRVDFRSLIVSLAGIFDDAHNLAIQLLNILTQRHQLAFFQHEVTKACDILDTDAFVRPDVADPAAWHQKENKHHLRSVEAW